MQCIASISKLTLLHLGAFIFGLSGWTMLLLNIDAGRVARRSICMTASKSVYAAALLGHVLSAACVGVGLAHGFDALIYWRTASDDHAFYLLGFLLFVLFAYMFLRFADRAVVYRTNKKP